VQKRHCLAPFPLTADRGNYFIFPGAYEPVAQVGHARPAWSLKRAYAGDQILRYLFINWTAKMLWPLTMEMNKWKQAEIDGFIQKQVQP
jgi:hypothetical protein